LKRAKKENVEKDNVDEKNVEIIDVSLEINNECIPLLI
jgi:hypothetical protein